MSYSLSGVTSLPFQTSESGALPYEMIDPDVSRMLQVRDGNMTAFQELVQRYQPRVAALLTKLVGHRRETDDLAQEVFLRVFRARDRYTPGSRFSTWLFTIVSNVASNARRALGRRREINPFDETRSQLEMQAIPHHSRDRQQEDPVQHLAQRERAEIVRKAIATLSQRQREAVLLNRVKGLSHAEIATRMDTSPKAIKSLLGRAHGILRSRLQPYMQNGWDIGFDNASGD